METLEDRIWNRLPKAKDEKEVPKRTSTNRYHPHKISKRIEPSIKIEEDVRIHSYPSKDAKAKANHKDAKTASFVQCIDSSLHQVPAGRNLIML